MPLSGASELLAKILDGVKLGGNEFVFLGMCLSNNNGDKSLNNHPLCALRVFVSDMTGCRRECGIRISVKSMKTKATYNTAQGQDLGGLEWN